MTGVKFSNGEQFPNDIRELLVDVLGEEVVYDPAAPYDERLHILAETQRAVADLRDRTRAIAEAAGMTISDEDVANWQPSQAEKDNLRSQLTRQRKTLSMIRGTEEYFEDLAEDTDRHGVPLRQHQLAVVEDFLRLSGTRAPNH